MNARSDLRDAIRIALDNVTEWHYEDRGYDYSICSSCGWNTREHRQAGQGFSHLDGCELRKALDMLEEFLSES